MASFKFSPFFATLLVMLLLQTTAFADDWWWDTLSNQLCDVVNCGKGKCVVNTSAPFNYECQCDAGWKRTRLDSEEDLQFLPCVIPNCSVEYSCMPAPPPLPPVPQNWSFFDPCYWIYCGGGTCEKSSNSTHTCQCDSGYTNLLNISVYPCFNDCAIGSDCSKLGINKLSSTTTGSSSSSGSHAFSVAPGSIIWMAVIATSIALVMKK